MKYNIFFLSIFLFFTAMGCSTSNHQNESLFFDIDFDKIPVVDINFPVETDSSVSFIIDHELNIKNEIDSTQVNFPLEVYISFTNVKKRVIENKANSKEIIKNYVPLNRIFTNEYENFSVKGLIKNKETFYLDTMIIGKNNNSDFFSILIKPQYFEIQSYSGDFIYQLEGRIYLNIYDKKRNISQDIFIPVHRLINIHTTSKIASKKSNTPICSKLHESIDIKLIPQMNTQIFSSETEIFIQKNIIFYLGAFNQNLPSDIKNEILKIPLTYPIKRDNDYNFFLNKKLENNQDSFIIAKVNFENKTFVYKIKIKHLCANFTYINKSIFNKSYIFSATSIIYIYSKNELLIGYIVFPVLEELDL